MAAAYGVPLGGALFALEVMRGALSLRLVLPAIMASLIATAISWPVLPDAVTYPIPDYPAPLSISVWAVLAGPIAGVVSVVYVRAIAWADHHNPKGCQRLAVLAIALGGRGVVSIWFPQLLGNGKDVSELGFLGNVQFATLLALLSLKPIPTFLCLGNAAPGGAVHAVADARGAAWRRSRARLVLAVAGVPAGEFALVGGESVLGATTHGPISAVVLMMELTGRDRSFIVPLLLGVATATLVSRTIERRSIYDARSTDAEVRAMDRDPASP
ncbi:chloride channel protein [Lichenifustis flavocetrariae]|uniref:Chloride channel protein n=1 Tax=Lichenifustis flavocetrariae TaxID=2949735 RepID=A0AA41Z024_9HYPH|nr:chloride channel protein [Lichenifustis flavocetrariae]MCW6511721.1 chloride channel protein [Lichenifustis flavocetrariae]